MTARVRVGTRLDPDTELPAVKAWATAERRTLADAIRVLTNDGLAWNDALSPVAASLYRLSAEDGIASPFDMARVLVIEALEAREARDLEAQQRQAYPKSAAAGNVHEFAGQEGNALRCETCGLARGQHR